MADRDRYELLKRLSEAPGPPGGEEAVRTIVRAELDGIGSIEHDRLGSLICELPGRDDTVRVLLDCHLDEVAFMVQSISKDGQIAFVPLGGWWGHVLLGQRIDLLTDEGTIPAVVGSKPPHFLTETERQQVLKLDAMQFDVGATNREQVEALGIRIGDLAVPHSTFGELAIPGRFAGKALDNRIGVALMIETLRAVAGKGLPPCRLIGVGAVQEEIGLRGAQTAGSIARPDLAIVLECTPADDLPGVSEPQGVLGGGPQLRFFDPTAIANRKLARWVIAQADSAGLPLQQAVRRSGGTNAGAIQRHGAGVPTVVLGVPARYIHSHVSIMDWSDYEAAFELLQRLVGALDAETVASFTHFDES